VISTISLSTRKMSPERVGLGQDGGNFRFLIDDGQSLDGCPQMGAMLRVPRPFESFDRFEIISFGLRTLGSPPNAWSFCAKKLPPEQP